MNDRSRVLLWRGVERRDKYSKENYPFFIAKSLYAVCGKAVYVKFKMMEGTLLVNADLSEATKLFKYASLCGIPLVMEPRKTPNTTRRVIFCFDLALFSEEEYKQEM